MAMESDALSVERVALNQSRFRALNERIEASNAAHVWVDPPMPDWVCECAFEACMVPVSLTIADYEAIRVVPTRFVVAPSDEHVVPEAELVVERNEFYWVVEKVGDAADITEALYPRSKAVATKPDPLMDAIAWNLPAARSERDIAR